jgi:MOSC domain-containing protein YiiM
MRLISVNIGQVRPIANAKSFGKTGIYKTGVDSAIQITPLGIPGDAIVDTQHHGGEDQAIYLYGSLDYDWWSGQLGRTIAPGTFGDNLTVEGLESASIFIGDRFSIGSVILEVTSPRIPCVTLAACMGDPGFVKRYRNAERPGMYCRVIQTGWVEAGQTVSCLPGSGDRISLIEMFRDFYEPVMNEAQLRRYLAAPIAIRDRVNKEKQLQELLAKANELAG